MRPVRTGESENYKTLRVPLSGSNDGSLRFDDFHEHTGGEPLYFSLPDDFLNNKVCPSDDSSMNVFSTIFVCLKISSYGGKIRIRFTFESDNNNEDQNPCLILRVS